MSDARHSDVAGAGRTGGPVLDASFVRRLAGIALRVQRASAAAGERPGARRVPAADFIDHRPYTPGDDLRHVDWHAAARHDQVSIKLGRAQDAADVRVLLDLSASMSALPDKQRATFELAAALGWLALVRGDRLSAAGFPPAAERWGPASGAARAPQWLAQISRWSNGDPVAAPEGEHGLAASARALMAAAPGGGLLLILSDLWRCEDLAAALQWAPAPRWRAIVLQVLDRSEIEPPEMGPVVLVDAETGQRQELVVDEAVRAAYGASFRARQARLQALCAARGAQLVTLPADWPLERQVLPFLRRRSVLAARRW